MPWDPDRYEQFKTERYAPFEDLIKLVRVREGLRVIDLSTEIAGPYCTKLLVDAGAEVIKVEAPAGDPLRHWTASGIELAPGEDGALFRYLNASKRSVVLDLEDAEGRDAALDLAATAALVIESFEPGQVDAWGLGPEALRVRNPSLSLVSISPWGGTGPWAHRPSTEFPLQASTGSTGCRRPTTQTRIMSSSRIRPAIS